MIIYITVILLPLILLFQNCSGVSFDGSTADKAQSSISGEMIDENTSEAIDNSDSDTGTPNNGSEIVNIGQSSNQDSSGNKEELGQNLIMQNPFIKNIPPFMPKDGPLEIVILVDDSFSNVVYAQRVMDGLRNLFDEIPKETLGIKIYTIGSRSKHNVIGSTSRTDRISDIEMNSISEYFINSPLGQIGGGAGLSDSQFAQDKQNLLMLVENHLDNVKITTDQAPSLQCETLAILSQELQSQNDDKRLVFIGITDEDSNQSTNQKCIKKMTVNKKKEGQITNFYLNVDYRRNLEGGGQEFQAQIVSYSIGDKKSCADLTRAEIDAWIAKNSSIMRANSKTHSSCTMSTRDLWRTQSYSRQSWLGFKDDQIPMVSQEINIALNQIGQAQVFYGLFSINSESDLKNTDQEVSENIINFITSILGNTNHSFNSLTDPNYGLFIENILNFKLNTEINRISIADFLNTINDPSRLRIQRINILNTNISVTDFSLQGGFLVIHDSRVNLSAGAQIEIVYGLIQ